MFEMAADGHGVHQIASALTDGKILIPTMYKYVQLGYKSNQFDENYPNDWRATTVKRILESRVYAGDIVSHKSGNKSFKNQKLVAYPASEWIVVEDMHEPIVDRDLFDRVQQLIKLKQRKNSLGLENIFLGLLKCADCGANLSHQAWQCKDGSIGGKFVCSRYRHSNGKEAGVKSCTAHYTPYANINAAVFARLRALIAANLSEDEVLHRLLHTQKAHIKNAQPCKRRVLRVSELCNGTEDRTGAQPFLEQIRRYSEAKELTREMLLRLVDHIDVHEPTGDRRAGTRAQELVIYYRFSKNP